MGLVGQKGMSTTSLKGISAHLNGSLTQHIRWMLLAITRSQQAYVSSIFNVQDMCIQEVCMATQAGCVEDKN